MSKVPIALRRHIRNLADAVAKSAKSPLTNAPSHKVVWGVVASIQPGPPQSLTLNVSGSTSGTPGIRYLATYMPTVGDTVMCSKYGGDLVVIGGMNGTVSGVGNVSMKRLEFAYNTPNLDTGVTIYTPKAGEVVLNGWIQPGSTVWDGTNPTGDIGTFTFTDQGWLLESSGLTCDMTVAPNVYGTDTVRLSGATLLETALFAYIGSFNDALGIGPPNYLAGSGPGYYGSWFPMVMTATPIKVVVSQNGKSGGGSPGSTQGNATAYLLTALV